MNEVDEPIDPTSWTTKELVKHLYREMIEMHSRQQEMLDAIARFERKEAERRAVYKTVIAISSVVGAIIGFLADYILTNVR
jgi:hypothetical protein